MADPGKTTTIEEEENPPRSIRWDLADWKRFKEAAQVLGEREHLDLGPLDIVRSGARRFADEILKDSTPTAKAS
jgi:hypothetical protein